MSYVKTIVKVGEQSTLHLRNTKLYRAITIDELKGLCDKLDAEIVIIESISDNEYGAASEFLKHYAESGHKVFFYTNSNDEYTNGLADELDLEVATNNEEMCKLIEVQCGINTRVDISIPTVETGEIDNFGMDGNLDIGLLEQQTDIFVEMPDIKSKESFDNSDLGIEEDEDKTTKVEDNTETKEVSVGDISDTSNTSDEEVSVNKETIIELENTKKELQQTKDRLAELHKVIKAVKDERDTFKLELQSIEEIDIITDAITIDEHNKLVTRAKELEEELSRSANISSEELSKLREQVNSLNDDNSKLELKNDELTRLVDEFKSNHDEDKIAELSSTIDELNSEINRINSEYNKCVDLLAKSNKKNEDITNQVEFERAIRQQLNDLLIATINKAETINVVENELEKSRQENERLIARLGNMTANLNDVVNKYNRLESAFNSKINQAKELMQSELDSIKKENSGLIAKLAVTTSELDNQKRIYSELIVAAGGDELGVRNLASQNTYLQEIVSTLRTKITELQEQKDKAENDKDEVQAKLQDTISRNESLAKQLNMSTGNFFGVPTTGLIHPISYTSSAKVILVTGTGSYGITTTALSIASKLAKSGRVTYIDFDMISAKADSWFKVSPLITGIGGLNPKAEMNSGLGLLVDKGIGFFIPYANSIMKYCELDGNKMNYISGFYSVPDTNKLISTNFEQFINFCGGSSDYTVIDFGRLGATELCNNIVRAFSKIALKTVVVSTNDKFDIRNARIILKKYNIDMENVAWLINLSEDTKMEEGIKKFILPASYYIMPFADDFYGKKKLFENSRTTRGRFEKFLNENILGRL